MSDNNLETRVNELEKKQVSIDTKLDAFIQEMRDFKAEMRQQNEMRAAEVRALRQENAAAMSEYRQENDKKIERIEKKIDQLETKMDSVNKYAHQMFLAAAIGIGAMILTVVVPMITSGK